MAEAAYERFNRRRRRAGFKTSAPATYRNTQPSYYRRAPEVVQGHASRARLGSPNIPSSITSQARSTSGGTGGFSSDVARQSTAWDRTLDQLTADFTQQAHQQEVVNRVMQQGEEQSGQGWVDKVLGGIMASPIGPVLYNAGRPVNALFQGLENLGGQEEQRGYSPEDISHSFGNFFGGLKSGWSYENEEGEHGPSGAGQVYEAIKENPESSTGGGLRRFEAWNPAAEQALAIGIGAAGEIALDPVDWLMPAAPAILRGSGRALTREGIEETVEIASREALQNAMNSNPALFSRSPFSPDMINARAQTALSDALNESILNVVGGGAPHARTMGGAAFPSLVSQRWGQDILNSISGDADQVIQSLKNNAASHSVASVDAARAASKDFDEFWFELTTEMMKKYPITGTTDEVLALLKGGRTGPIHTVMDEIWTGMRNRHYVQIQPHIDELYKTVENPTTRTLGLRIGKGSNSRVIPVPAVGRAFGWAGSQLNKVPGIQGIGSALYERAFPALFAGKISRASAYGVKGLDNFMRDLERITKGNLPSGNTVRAFTPDQAKELFKAMGNNAFTFGDARMDEALTWLRDQRNTRFTEELREGARSVDNADGSTLAGKQFDPNYQYLHLRGGTKRARAEFMEGYRNAYKTLGHPGQYTIEEAARRGLRPIDDAFQIAQLHYMDSAKKITNAYMWQDLAANYGLMNKATVTGVSALEKEARNLAEIEYGKLSEAFKQMVKDTGGKFYIPNTIHDFGRNFDNMMNWSTANMGQFGRSFSKIINKFKAMITIPYLGFHVRNFMGDTMMGMLDGVNPARYTEVMTKYAKSRRGLANNFNIIPGVDLTFTELMRQFREEVNTGFIHMDLGTQATKTAGRIGRLGRRVVNTAKSASDDRELLPRVTHYLQALRDEAKALYRDGARNTDEIMRRARDAALWRVNHYKFDYAALMPWERNLKSLAFPFYTYSRKAIPTLMEQMFLNPHYFQMVNRWMMDNDGSAADAFNYMNMPQWVRDFGYGAITDEANPLALTGEIFPTNVLDVISSNTAHEGALDVLSQANPAFQIPIELAMGRTAFDDRPIQGGMFDYLSSKVPFVGDIQSRFSNVPGMPGTSENPVSGGGWSWEKFLNDRLLGLGMPIRRISESQQEQQSNANFDQLVEGPINEYNYSQDRFSINMNGDGVFEIHDKFTGSSIGPKFATPQEAIQFAQTRLQNYQQPDQSFINRPPTGADLQELLMSQRLQ